MELISCETCQHRVRRRNEWTPHGEKTPRESIWHECHAHAPSVLVLEREERTCWPTIELDDRCGEWDPGKQS